MLDTESNHNSPDAPEPGVAPAKKAKKAPAKAATKAATKAPTKAPAKRTPRKVTSTPEPAPEQSSAVETVAPEASPHDEAPAAKPTKATRSRSTAKRVAKKAVADAGGTADAVADAVAATQPAAAEPAAAEQAKAAPAKAAKKATRRRAAKVTAPAAPAEESRPPAPDLAKSANAAPPALAPPVVLFQPPSESIAVGKRRRPAKAAAQQSGESATPAPPVEEETSPEAAAVTGDEAVELPAEGTGPDETREAEEQEGGGRRRRRRGRRGRGRAGDDKPEVAGDTAEASETADADEDEEEIDHAEEVAEAALSASARRRRRRRRSGTSGDAEGTSEDDPPNTVVHVRESRTSGRGSDADSDGVRGVKGSTRLEAKRQRRRDNRDSGRRRAPILTEAEFLARRESVDRVMAVRQTGDRTQIAVLEDDVLVEHYVTRASSASAVGNVYLGRVQNVLPSMEAAFIDIGRGRNGVLYAGEVNWEAAGLEGKSRAIESALSSGDSVLVQVTKDPIGHKGARLTSQISLPGRFVVYVPGGGMTGISRKLPDVERSRLKSILKKVVPDDAGVIVRTAAEGASEADLVSDVERLKSQWEAIQAKAAKPGSGPSLVYGEPDLAIRVVRDVFNDDFSKLVVASSDIHRTITDYVSDVAPDLRERISLHTGESDLFADLRVDEQLAKALDRKVFLPSGGSLVIDRTEAMVVIDVNTGKYTGSGGNLEQTVTRNNLEAAEEIVRQLRLRDIGGIVVIDFIDMVLESNRDLVLRRLTECLGRDRTKHQVAEVTSLGLVQMTRKRVGEGLLEAFSEPCEHCRGRGVIVHTEPVDRKSGGTAQHAEEEERPARAKRSSRKAKASSETVDAAAQAAEAEKRRAAASAIAAIAAATSHHEDEREEPSVAPTEDQVAAAESAVDVAVDAVAGVISAAAPIAEPDAVVSPDGAGGRTPRPRRRRAASRPAGPPAQAAGQPDGQAGAQVDAQAAKQVRLSAGG